MVGPCGVWLFVFGKSGAWVGCCVEVLQLCVFFRFGAECSGVVRLGVSNCRLYAEILGDGISFLVASLENWKFGLFSARQGCVLVVWGEICILWNSMIKV